MAMDTKDAAPHLNYGTLLARLGQTERAIEVLQAGMQRRDPTRNTLRLCNNLGTIYYKRRDFDAAKSMFQASMEVSRQSVGIVLHGMLLKATSDTHARVGCG